MIKKLLILIFLVSICSSKAFSKPLVISSVNDIIKRNRGENIRGFYHALLAKRTFTGMDLLFKELGPDVIFVSSRSDIFKSNIEELLLENGVPYLEVYTQGLWEFSSDYAYKLHTIKRILNTTRQKVILIGDDEGVDEEVYLQVAKDFPEKVERIYLREVKGEVLSSALVWPFTNAYDLAVAEYRAGRLGMSALKDIAKDIISEEKLHKVFPQRMTCQKVLEKLNARDDRHPLLASMTENVRAKVYDYCDDN